MEAAVLPIDKFSRLGAWILLGLCEGKIIGINLCRVAIHHNYKKNMHIKTLQELASVFFGQQLEAYSHSPVIIKQKITKIKWWDLKSFNFIAIERNYQTKTLCTYALQLK